MSRVRALIGTGRSLALSTWRRPNGRVGIPILAGLVVLAVTADFWAADKPVLLRLDGTLYLLPNLSDPVALRAHTNQSLLASMGDDDWLVPPLVAWGPNEHDKGERPLAAPSSRHLLGTDAARRDVLARLIHGSRASLTISLAAVALYVMLGTLLGLFAAYFGGLLDAVTSRLSEAVIAMPAMFLVLAVMGVTEQAGQGAMILVVSLVYWTRVARLVRAEVLRLKRTEFVAAALALGFSHLRIMFRHILPNAMAPVLVTATFGIASAMLLEASLSFLGFGTPDSTASWGGLLHGAMGHFHAWWLVVFPGAAIFLAVMGCNLTGEALRDALDPRSRPD